MSQGLVLIVDDDAAVRKSLLRYLEDAEYDVFGAESESQALGILAEHQISIAVVDMRLAGDSGETLILRSHAMQPQLRFLVYTGSNTFEVTPAMRNVGMRPEHILRKPVESLQVILDTINRLFDEIREGIDD